MGMSVPTEDCELLTVSENGYGKRTSLDEYRLQSRGGMGTKNYKVSDITGKIIGIDSVKDNEDIILITSEGIIIRIEANDIRSIGRSTKGVKLMRVSEGVKVVSMGKTAHEENEEKTDNSNENETPEKE